MVGFKKGDLVKAYVELSATRVEDDETALQGIALHFAGEMSQVEVSKIRVNSKGYNEAKMVFGNIGTAYRARAALSRCGHLETANVGWGNDP